MSDAGKHRRPLRVVVERGPRVPAMAKAVAGILATELLAKVLEPELDALAALIRSLLGL